MPAIPKEPSTPPAVNGVFSPPPTPGKTPERNPLDNRPIVSKNDTVSIESQASSRFDTTQQTLVGSSQEEPQLFTNGTHGNSNGDFHDIPVPLPPKTNLAPPLGAHSTEAGGPRSRSHARIHTYADDEGRRGKFPRISKPVELIRSEYDCIVIGSGYGGGIAASRMARAGESVCVLERGREKWPGEYPSGALSAFNELHYSGKFAPGFLEGKLVNGGDPSGMYHLIFGKGQNAVVCNGTLSHSLAGIVF
jgi:hypothetical protein